MSNLLQVVRALKTERQQTQAKLDQLDDALRALGASGRRGKGRTTGRTQPGRKRRTLSLAARKRIAAAQRARWAKLKAAKQK